MLGIFNLIENTSVKSERFNKLFNGLKESTNKLNDTLNDLIKILIIKEDHLIELANINFEEIFKRVVNSIEHTITSSNTLIKCDFTEVPEIKFSKVYLESILLNLLSNAIKFRTEDQRPIINIKSCMVNGCVQLRFSDNGTGMDWNKVKDKVFGLYQQFHSNSSSRGIGLYLIHAQVTALGGTIELETELNKGTTFIISFRKESN